MTNQTEQAENNQNEVENDDPVISKSQRKREAHDAQKLGENLLQLDPNSLKTIDLPDDLSKALDDARSIKKNSALKRQLQYIGKIMRRIDIEPILVEYNKIINHYGKDIKQLHRLEKWRDRLIAEGDKALEDLVQEAADTDRQHVRQLIRQANKETKLNKPPKSSREIFQYLKSLLQ